LSAQAIARLRHRKDGEDTVWRALPSEDQSRQWKGLLGSSAKKPRCSQCTRPLKADDRQLMCRRCAEGDALDDASRPRPARIDCENGQAERCRTPSTQANSEDQDGEAASASQPPTPDVTASLKRLAGDWTDLGGEQYSLSLSSDDQITCFREDDEQTVTLYFDPRDKLVWWGKNRAYFLDLSELDWNFQHLKWHDSGNGQASRPAMQWRRSPREVLRTPVCVKRWSKPEAVESLAPAAAPPAAEPKKRSNKMPQVRKEEPQSEPEEFEKKQKTEIPKEERWQKKLPREAPKDTPTKEPSKEKELHKDDPRKESPLPEKPTLVEEETQHEARREKPTKEGRGAKEAKHDEHAQQKPKEELKWVKKEAKEEDPKQEMLFKEPARATKETKEEWAPTWAKKETEEPNKPKKEPPSWAPTWVKKSAEPQKEKQEEPVQAWVRREDQKWVKKEPREESKETDAKPYEAKRLGKAGPGQVWRAVGEKDQQQDEHRGEEDEKEKLAALAIKEITEQLMEPANKGFVWVEQWHELYSSSFGTVRSFIESYPDKFRVVPTTGRGYRVALASLKAKGR